MLPATRAEALHQLQTFIPLAAGHYAKERNFDRGPNNRNNVSLLSAAIQRRLISEKEVLEAVAKVHSLEVSEKFSQEVLWRSYWKSWLELRPNVWRNYQNSLENLKTQNVPLIKKTLSAQTGIECFDFWTKELFETGYLHNHARMWFASIWIFTLRLPWEWGAKLFEEQLCDFDPASNTLSWRWVAGLHTPGKHYVATAKNIETFTEGRFSPQNQLNEAAENLSFEGHLLEPVKENFIPLKMGSKKVGILVHPEDFSIETLDWKNVSPVSVAVIDPKLISLRGNRISPVQALNQAALKDTVQRLSHFFSCGVEVLQNGNLSERVTEWGKSQDLEELILMKPWQGYLNDSWKLVEKSLKSVSINCRYLRRDYDKELSGKAKSGFFSFKSELPEVWKRIKSEGPKEELWEVIS